MSQCFLAFQHGSLGIERPKKDPGPFIPPGGQGWIKSHLDDICQDLLELFPTNALPRPRHGNSVRFSRKYRAQYRLVRQDGVMEVKRPQIRYSESRNDAGRITASESRMNLDKPKISILALPVEVRLCIYRYLLISRSFPVICPQPGGFRVLSTENYDAPLGLYPQILTTCHQINREGTSILYSENVFRREFYWRRKYTRSTLQHWPRADSSPLTVANLQSVCRIRIFRGYHQWFRRSLELKVIRDFPSLKELQVHIDLNDLSRGVDLKSLWKDTMKAISRDKPNLVCLKTRIRLRFDQDYKDWCERCRARPLDFSLHKMKRKELEEWAQAEGLFQGRSLTWTFTTQTSFCTGPDAVVAFSFNSRTARRTNAIECCTEDCSEEGCITNVSTEPV